MKGMVKQMNASCPTLAELTNAIRELRGERRIAECDFYSDRRKALDVAISLMEQKAREISQKGAI